MYGESNKCLYEYKLNIFNLLILKKFFEHRVLTA